MKSDKEFCDAILTVLNRALAKDPEAMAALVKARVPCNKALADDPTIQVGSKDGIYTVGFVGMLSGIIGEAIKDHYVAADYEMMADIESGSPRSFVIGVLGESDYG